MAQDGRSNFVTTPDSNWCSFDEERSSFVFVAGLSTGMARYLFSDPRAIST